MPVFYDPKSGERFANVPDAEVERAQKEFGLVSEGEYQARQSAEQRPFAQSAGEAVQAVGNTLMRPLEAIGEALPRSPMAEVGERVGDTWSPSSDDSRRIAQEHPIASALPLMGEALLPGGLAVQLAAGTVAGAAESTFQGGGQYGEIDPSELALAAGMSVLPVAGGAAVRRLGQGAAAVASGTSQGMRAAGRAAGEKLSELGAGKAIGKAGDFVKDEAVDYAVNAATGGLLPRFLRGAAGNAIKKVVKGAIKGGESGLGLRPAAEAVDAVAPQAGVPWNMWTPIDAESVTIGTGLSPIFQRAEREMSPAFSRAKEIIEKRRGQGGSVGVGGPSGPVSPKEWVKVGRSARESMAPDEADVLRVYSEQGYRGVNAHLRGKPDARNPEYFADMSKRVSAALDGQVAKGNVTPGVVYRQVDNARYADLKPGDSFSDPAVMSTSQHEMGARSLERVDSPLLFEIRQRTGVPNMRKSATGRINDEREVLMRPGTKFRVTGETQRDVFGRPTRVLQVEEVGASTRGGERGFASLGAGPNFSLGDVAKSPMGVVTGLGAAGLVGNVLARAERRANESIDFDDLEGLPPADRRAALVSNGARYAKQATESAADALAVKTEAAIRAKDAGRALVFERAGEPSDAQRAYAGRAQEALEMAEHALRTSGQTEAADGIGKAVDDLTDVAVAHQQKLPVSHDAGALLSSLDQAYASLQAVGDTLPDDARAALDELAVGTTDPALWGDAAGMLEEMRAADAAADAAGVLASHDEEAWRRGLREHLVAARQQLDVLARWGVDTERFEKSVDELEAAVDRGDAVAAELRAAGVNAHDSGADPGDEGPMGEILGAVARETGVSAGIDELLTPALRLGLEDQQKAFRYDTALRSVQRGSEVRLRKAALGAVGMGSGLAEADQDATSAEFSAGYSDDLAAFEARRETLQQLASDPMALADATAQSYGEMVRTHPEAFDQITELVSRAAAVLTAAMPASLQNSFRQPNGLPPSVDDVRAFARVYMTVTEPDTYLRDLGSGQAWPEQSQAFAKMFPAKWQELAQTAVEAAKQRGPALSPQDATYLDITFGIGNTIGGMWSDSGAQAIRDAIQQAADAKEQAKGKLPQSKPGAGIPQSATASLKGPSSLPVS